MPNTIKPAKKRMTPEQRKRKVLANAVRSMNFIMGDTSSTSEQSRDFNKECGYPADVSLLDIWNMYKREGVAQRIVHVYPVETWKTWPSVYETEKQKMMPFEIAVEDLVSRFNLWSILERADKMSGLGNFGIVLLGVNDGKKLNEPVSGIVDDSETQKLDSRKTPAALELRYMRVYDQRQVEIDSLETDETSPRYGRPVFYKVRQTSDSESRVTPTSSQKHTMIHWSRVIHLADNRTDNSEIAGVPRMEPAYNRVLDLLKVLGGSSEMFWKGGFPGLSFEVQPGLEDLEFDKDAFKEEIDNYANGLQRYLRLLGVRAVSLSPQVADPSPQIHAGLDQICITINCPKRIFLGTESAHLASTQDQKTWMDRITGRRNNYVVPNIIRPVFVRFVQMGILPVPASGNFKVDWEDPDAVDPLVRAQAFEKIVNAMSQYVSSGLATMVPPLEFMTRFLKVPLIEAQEILDAAQSQISDSKKLPLVQATDANKIKSEQAQNKAGSSGTNTPGKSGRKSGTGMRRESVDVSTGQNGG